MIERKTLIFSALIALLLSATSGAVILAQWPPQMDDLLRAGAGADAGVPLYWLTFPFLYASILLTVWIALFVNKGALATPGLQRPAWLRAVSCRP